MTKRMVGVIVLAALASMGQNDCDGSAGAARRKETEEVGRQQEQYVRNQPTPFFDWSLERHLLIELYRARNNAVGTFSYVRSPFTGKILSWCPSIGFPIPADTQLTNPEYWVGQGFSMPQAEPNGLYTSQNTRGTYVMCIQKGGKVAPRYFEADVEAYVTPMREQDGILVEDGPASFTIDAQRPRNVERVK